MSLEELFIEKNNLYNELKELSRQQYALNGDKRRIEGRISRKNDLMENSRNPRLHQQLEEEVQNDEYALHEAESGLEEVTNRIASINEAIEDIKKSIEDIKSNRGGGRGESGGGLKFSKDWIPPGAR